MTVQHSGLQTTSVTVQHSCIPHRLSYKDTQRLKYETLLSGVNTLSSSRIAHSHFYSRSFSISSLLQEAPTITCKLSPLPELEWSHCFFYSSCWFRVVTIKCSLPCPTVSAVPVSTRFQEDGFPKIRLLSDRASSAVPHFFQLLCYAKLIGHWRRPHV